jgi:NTE family protein
MDISIALSGGGVRGIAHIGVLRTLEKHGLNIKAIAGTSAGGLVGAVYAAGISINKMEDAFKDLNANRSFSRDSHDNPSLLGLTGVTETLSGLLGDRSFDDLKIPFAATAVSLKTGKEIILTKGKVLDAVLATIAIPGVFPSQEIGGQVLVDGGVLDPVPVQVARWMKPKLPVFAVVLHGEPDNEKEQDLSLPLPIPGPTPIVERLMKLKPVQAFRIFSRSMDITTRQLSNLSIKLYKPEVIISPKVGHLGVLQDINIEETIKIGVECAEAALESIMEKSNWERRLLRAAKKNATATVPDYWEKINSTYK